MVRMGIAAGMKRLVIDDGLIIGIGEIIIHVAAASEWSIQR